MRSGLSTTTSGPGPASRPSLGSVRNQEGQTRAGDEGRHPETITHFLSGEAANALPDPVYLVEEPIIDLNDTKGVE